MNGFPSSPESGAVLSTVRGGRPLVLVVEDEPDLAELIRFHLEQEGFTVKVCTSGDIALAEARRKRPDAVLLDLLLPGVSGLEVCRRMRSEPQLASVPILMVTAKAEEADRVIGLELGADDYITKPFSPRELVARLRAVLRRTYSEKPARAPDVYERGWLRVDFDQYEVTVEGEPVELSRKEFELLRFFLRHPNRVFDRLHILDSVWGEDTHVEVRTVDVHIRRLRQVLEPEGRTPSLIVTVRGVGYKLDERALDRPRKA
jgi:phosphate regulon transcriptional regulator PhoB